MKPVLLLAALMLSAATLPAQAGNGNCPPGLAKKSPACVPPGLAKKGVTAGEWRRGDHIGDADYHEIRYPDRYDLPPLEPGQSYYVIDGQILRVDRETREVLDFIRATAALLD